MAELKGRWAFACGVCAVVCGLVLAAARTVEGGPAEGQGVETSADPTSSETEGLEALECLQKEVTLRPPYTDYYPRGPEDHLALQFAVQEVCRQAGLRYGLRGSETNVGDQAKVRVSPHFAGIPLRQALERMLRPHGLTYEVKDSMVILHTKASLPGGPKIPAPPPARRRASSRPGLPTASRPASGDVGQQMIGQAVAAAAGLTVADKAHNAATAIAQYRLVYQVPGLQQAQQKLANARQTLVRIRVEGDALKPEYDSLAAAVREAEQKVKDWEETGWRSGTTVYFEGTDLYQLRKWEGRLTERTRAFEPVRRRYEQKFSEYRQAETELRTAQAEWTRLAAQYQAELAKTYNEVHPRCLEVLKAIARDSAEKARDASLAATTSGFQPGKFAWMKSGKVLGELEFRADGSCSGVEGTVAEGARWEVTDEGLVVTQESHRWLFRAGPAGTYMGRCTSEDVRMNNQTAMLRPVKPAPEAAPAQDEPAADAAPAPLKTAADSEPVHPEESPGEQGDGA